MNFQNGTASMKRKSLISKWNQNKKQVFVFENQLCNYLNATRGLHKTKKRHQQRSTEMSLYIISLFRPKDVVWLI
jgi:GntR family transcriptional regulator/MocR family aminotransferase